jgi:hypothetical protein
MRIRLNEDSIKLDPAQVPRLQTAAFDLSARSIGWFGAFRSTFEDDEGPGFGVSIRGDSDQTTKLADAAMGSGVVHETDEEHVGALPIIGRVQPYEFPVKGVMSAVNQVLCDLMEAQPPVEPRGPNPDGCPTWEQFARLWRQRHKERRARTACLIEESGAADFPGEIAPIGCSKVEQVLAGVKKLKREHSTLVSNMVEASYEGSCMPMLRPAPLEFPFTPVQVLGAFVDHVQWLHGFERRLSGFCYGFGKANLEAVKKALSLVDLRTAMRWESPRTPDVPSFKTLVCIQRNFSDFLDIYQDFETIVAALRVATMGCEQLRLFQDKWSGCLEDALAGVYYMLSECVPWCGRLLNKRTEALRPGVPTPFVLLAVTLFDVTRGLLAYVYSDALLPEKPEVVEMASDLMHLAAKTTASVLKQWLLEQDGHGDSCIVPVQCIEVLHIMVAWKRLYWYHTPEREAPDSDLHEWVRFISDTSGTVIAEMVKRNASGSLAQLMPLQLCDMHL